MALSESTDSDIACSIEDEILQLHRDARMIPGEWTKTAIKTVWSIGHLFSSLEDRSPEELKCKPD